MKLSTTELIIQLTKLLIGGWAMYKIYQVVEELQAIHGMLNHLGVI